MAKKAMVLDPSTGRIKQSDTNFAEESDSAVVAAAGKIPRADSVGKIDNDWVPLLDIASLPVASDGEVASTKVVRADDSRLGNTLLGGDLSGTTASATVAKIQGRAVQNISPSNGNVMTWNNAASRWEPAAPSAGSSLTVAEIDGAPSVSAVNTIRVTNGALIDEGGGVVTLAVGGSGGSTGDGVGGLLYLFSTYR